MRLPLFIAACVALSGCAFDREYSANADVVNQSAFVGGKWTSAKVPGKGTVTASINIIADLDDKQVKQIFGNR